MGSRMELLNFVLNRHRLAQVFAAFPVSYGLLMAMCCLCHGCWNVFKLDEDGSPVLLEWKLLVPVFPSFWTTPVI